MSTIPKYLVIVESPAKIKKLGQILGSEYTIVASFGHFRDLPAKSLAVDVENKFAPTYVITKHNVVKTLKEKAKTAKTVFLASDPDREGDAIAWHAATVMGISYPKARRMTFHEITAPAVRRALQEAQENGQMDMNKVNSQQARRVVDRLVGYKVSPQLWKHVRGAGSAGRVQSVATRLVVDKEQDIEKHVPEEKYLITGTFTPKDERKETVSAKLHQVPKKHEEAMQVLEFCKTAEFKVQGASSKIVWHSPPPAFKTSVLQQEAGKRFGMTPKQTMFAAQKLYEKGKITYHRTDVTRLSDTFKEAAKGYIEQKYGTQFLSDAMKKFKPGEEKKDSPKKKKGEQAAHEAIRPTDVNSPILAGGEFSQQERKIYRMIWVRAVASLMAKEKCRRYTAPIHLSNTDKYYFIATHLITLFLGFKILTQAESDDSDGEAEANALVANLKDGDLMDYIEILSKQSFTEPPKRFTEATLVKELEKKGIGRPSTYASIISTIQARAYVAKTKSVPVKKPCKIDTLSASTSVIASKTVMTEFGDRKMRLSPTPLGFKVNEFLFKNLRYMMEYSFTADLENQLDHVAEGDVVWDELVGDVYSTLMKLITAIPGPPKLSPEEKKARAEKGKQERIIGTFESHPIEFYLGRFGPFVKHNGSNYSLPKTMTDQSSITEAIAIKAITASRPLVDYECTLDTKEGRIRAVNGPYGIYLKFVPKSGKAENYFLPKDLKTDEAGVRALTLEQCLEHVQSAKEYKKNPPKKAGKTRKGRGGKFTRSKRGGKN